MQIGFGSERQKYAAGHVGTEPMDTSLVELVPELLELTVYGLVSVVLSIAGAYIERAGVAAATGGQPTLGAWLAFMGLLVIGAAYLLATDRLVPKLWELAG